MPTVKLNVSLDARIVETLKRRSRAEGKPASRYLAELIEADERKALDELAAAGYRDEALNAETLEFAEAALTDRWPEWND